MNVCHLHWSGMNIWAGAVQLLVERGQLQEHETSSLTCRQAGTGGYLLHIECCVMVQVKSSQFVHVDSRTWYEWSIMTWYWFAEGRVYTLKIDSKQ